MKDTHVEVLVNGKTVRQYQHGAATYIEARAGTEYSIKIKNDTYCRKLAVITVDGLNVITGTIQPDDICGVTCGHLNIPFFRAMHFRQ